MDRCKSLQAATSSAYCMWFCVHHTRTAVWVWCLQGEGNHSRLQPIPTCCPPGLLAQECKTFCWHNYSHVWKAIPVLTLLRNRQPLPVGSWHKGSMPEREKVSPGPSYFILRQHPFPATSISQAACSTITFRACEFSIALTTPCTAHDMYHILM